MPSYEDHVHCQACRHVMVPLAETGRPLFALDLTGDPATTWECLRCGAHVTYTPQGGQLWTVPVGADGQLGKPRRPQLPP